MVQVASAKSRRKCVTFGRFLKVNNMRPVKAGETIEGELSCKKKKRDLVYVGNAGNRDFKHAKGGCKFGWRYQYKAKDGTMKYGCTNVKSSPLVSVATIKRLNPSARIPFMPVKHREKKSTGRSRKAKAPPTPTKMVMRKRK